MQAPAIVRAAYLNLYLDGLRRVGLPVERSLAAAGLPATVEEMPDAYIGIGPALAAVGGACRDLSLAELAELGASSMTTATFSAPLRAAVLGAPTGFRRLGALLRWVSEEENALVPGMTREGDFLRVVLDMPRFAPDPYYPLAEWLNVEGIIAVVRTFAGAAWCPPAITFVATTVPSEAATARLGRCRFLTSQRHTSVLVEGALLRRPCQWRAAAERTRLPDRAEPTDWSFGTVLRAMIQPYLGETGFPLEAAAEMVGMSRRTLQRRLRDLGTSYSSLVDEARCDLARRLLADPELKIIDVAMLSGYENPQNFSRAFARLNGMTPSAFRRGAMAAG